MPCQRTRPPTPSGAVARSDRATSRFVAILATVAAVALLGLLCLVLPAHGQEAGVGGEGFAERPEEVSELVDEDEQFAPKRQEYAFNPVQARNELKVGNYYAKKGSYRAAAGRYEEATRWDASFAEAYWRLGLALERLGSREEAVRAYTTFLRIEPDGRKARTVRRSLARLEEAAERLPLAAKDSEHGDLVSR